MLRLIGKSSMIWLSGLVSDPGCGYNISPITHMGQFNIHPFQTGVQIVRMAEAECPCRLIVLFINRATND